MCTKKGEEGAMAQLYYKILENSNFTLGYGDGIGRRN